jgi:ArsR family transcriptional regulator
MTEVEMLRALASERRLLILQWLKTPLLYFPPQTEGDLVSDGVCGILIAEKLGISQSTLSEHMRLLVSIGLVEAKRVKQWVFYRRNADRAAEICATIASKI